MVITGSFNIFLEKLDNETLKGISYLTTVTNSTYFLVPCDI